MKFTQKEFEDKIKEIVTDTVQPMIESQGKSLEDFKGEIDSKVKEMLGKKEKSIEIHENFHDDPKGGFKCFSQFARDVARAEKSGGRSMSPELKIYSEKSTQKAAGTGLSESDGEFGGYLIPTEFRNTLMNAVEEANDILPLTTQIPMGSNIVEVPFVNGFDHSGGLVFGGIQWKWTDEEGSLSETRPKIGKMQMKLNKLTGLAYVSDEILADSPQSMEALLRNGFTNGLNFQYNNFLIRGTGAGTPLGILNAACLVSVAAEANQQAATIYFENILKMYASAYNPSRCVWVANPNTLPQLATMSLAVGTGGVPVWMPAGGASGKPYNTLMGLPLFFNDHCSTIGTKGDIFLCNWAEYLIGKKAGSDVPDFDTSIHFKFDVMQTAYRFCIRICGQPWWPTYFTPPVATTSYRSPFVSLDTRS